MASNLILHQGAFSATREQVDLIVTPDCTNTWTPIPHSAILEAILEAGGTAGFKVCREAYGLSGRKEQENYGSRMFGVIDFNTGTDDYGYSIGVRNSHDKSMVAGICAGTRIFVCDNLAFSGDFSEKRKHTPGNNFLRLVKEAFTLLPEQLENLTKNLDRLKLEGISDQDAEHLIWNAARVGAINSSMMLPVWQEYKEPTYEDFQEATQFNLLMAFTEKLKAENRITRVEQAYRKLADVFVL